MRALLDEDVHVGVLNWLIKSGHDTIRVPSGIKNGDVLKLAHCESRVLITRDKDFLNRLMYPPSQYQGIVVLRVHPPQLEKLIAALQALFVKLPNPLFAGKVVIVEEQGYHLLT